MAEPMRVGFLIDRWQPGRGGAEAALAALAAYLAERGHEVLAFATRGPEGSAPGSFRPVHVRGLSRVARERALARALPAAAADAGCDATVGVRHLVAADLLWLHGGSHVATLEARWRARHGGASAPSPLWLRGRHRLFATLERGLLEGGARAVACPSGLVERELAERYPGARARLVRVPNGVDLERFHPAKRARERAALRAELGLDASVPLLAFPAREPVLKGLPFLAPLLRERLGRPWHLLVAGPPRAGRWRRSLVRAGLPPRRVSVLPDVPSVRLAAGVDLCVQPTWRDPCSLATLEALAAGTPVVTTAANGASEVLETGAGWVVPDPASGDALGAALDEALERVGSGAVAREAVRACVAQRGRAAWLGALETLLVRVSAERRGQ